MIFYKINPWQLLLMLTAAAFLFVHEPAVAQDASPDNTPPVIDLEELADGVADNSQVFTVQITEETELRDATLYYRRNGQEPYTRAPMQAIGSSELYTVSIDTDPTDLRAIEYYIEARDTAGNRTVSGFAFDPYSRSLTPSLAIRSQPQAVDETSTESQKPTIATNSPFYKKRWFQVTLGVIAVGALASTLGGDDDDNDTQLVPVTINLE